MFHAHKLLAHTSIRQQTLPRTFRSIIKKQDKDTGEEPEIKQNALESHEDAGVSSVMTAKL